MIPPHAPFSPEQSASLTALISGFSPEQSTWLSGFLAGLSPQPAAAPASLTVVYGTESGNCEELADRTVKAAKKKGVKASMKNLADMTPADLAKADNLAVIISTWGDGEPPEAAEEFMGAFATETPDLKGTRFTVCALGDTSYEKYCEMGRIFDSRLEALGAERITEREECDVDYEDSYAAWADRLFAELGSGATVAVADFGAVAAPTVEYGKKNYFPAEVLDNVLLNGKGTEKETIHVELSLEGSGLVYEAGDALAVVPSNAEDVISDILKVTGFSESEEVEIKGGEKVSLGEALRSKLDITAVSRAIVKKYLALGANADLEKLLSDESKAEFMDWIWGRQIVDLLETYPVAGLTAQQFASILRKLPPRLYSIASSPKAHPGEVHLTVAAVRYDGHGKDRKGVASTFLVDEAPVGEKVQVYVHSNKNFRLPENDDTPVIMVGPGTGIAPFRAFVEERDERGAKGESWLFFGDQKYNFDFLYQLEWQDHLKSGALSKLDVAFSRDQPEKVYVQDVMKKNADEVYAWLEKGAYLYVCGDANRMAKDVHDALIEIVSIHGKLSQEEATAYVDQLKKDKRYQRDVY
ncbi:flavodoxin domain-containing protein [Akkermansiaceae bacterium]|nr:flavodoxin domain-containing protein [Akkermansiaceae bacterium]MDB4274212.1 flavodoxin domain-containing protein [Akkermansiaceae bacterium]MDB4570202.1 flavodoxin domain-containing protein [Akkermansiaceae bacterium]